MTIFYNKPRVNLPTAPWTLGRRYENANKDSVVIDHRPTLHFVYAVPFHLSRRERLREDVARYARRLRGSREPGWRNGKTVIHSRVVSSPASITINVMKHFKQSYVVKLYDWAEPGCAPMKADDILVGLPCHLPKTIVRNTLQYKQGIGTKVILMPYSHGIMDMQEWVYPYYELADSIGAITGTYWFDTIATSPFAIFRDKMVRIDMAVTPDQYPRIKRSFNPHGQRGFLYVGHSQTAFPYKGVHLLSELAGKLPDMRFGWIGNGPSIPHVDQVSSFGDLTPEFMVDVVRDYDFLITMGVSDANPTTILEAMAWGLPVICTPQSGYYNMPSIINVTLDDMARNVAILRQWQQADDDELYALADTNRRLVETHYTWNTFNRRLEEAIALGAQRRAG